MPLVFGLAVRRVLCAIALGASTAGAAALDDSALRALLDPADPNHLVGLQVAVVIDGQVTALAFGRRFVHPSDRAQDLPMTVDTLLRAASASKPIAAIAVLQEVERGRLALDADVSRYLGFPLRNPRFPEQRITLRQLLSHTSSVVDGEGYNLPLGERLRAYFEPGPHWNDGAHFSAHAPGSYFEYSNLGWGLLGTVLEKVTGERFDRVAARVLARAGIEGGFDVAGLDADQRARLAVLYRKGPEDAAAWVVDGPWIAQMDDPRAPAAGGSGKWSAPGAAADIGGYRPGDNGSLFSPQGGLRTNAGALARLWLCLLRGAAPGVDRPGRGLLEARTRAAMFKPQWSFDPQWGWDPQLGLDFTGNGATLDGEFLSWGLGVQLFTGAHAPEAGRMDSPSALLDGRPLVGHLAEAYGLFGGALFTPDGRFGVVYFANGSAQPFSANCGTRSALMLWEEVIIDWAAREAWRMAPEAPRSASAD